MSKKIRFDYQNKVKIEVIHFHLIKYLNKMLIKPKYSQI